MFSHRLSGHVQEEIVSGSVSDVFFGVGPDEVHATVLSTSW